MPDECMELDGCISGKATSYAGNTEWIVAAIGMIRQGHTIQERAPVNFVDLQIETAKPAIHVTPLAALNNLPGEELSCIQVERGFLSCKFRPVSKLHE